MSRSRMQDRILAMQGKALLSASLNAVPSAPKAAAPSPAPAPAPAATAGAGTGAGAGRARSGSMFTSREERRQDIERKAGISLWSKLPDLRSAEDYAKGAMFGSSSIKSGMLKFSKKHVRGPLTQLPSRLEDVAKAASKLLLKWSEGSDDDAKSTEALVEFLALGRENLKPLSTELYMQLCKQWNDNPNAASHNRIGLAWSWMAGCVPPAEEAAPYIANFLIGKQHDSAYPHARYALARLRETGVQGYVGDLLPCPDVEQVQASLPLVPRVMDVVSFTGEVVAAGMLISTQLTAEKLLVKAAHKASLPKALLPALCLHVQREVESSAGSLGMADDGSTHVVTALESDAVVAAAVTASSSLALGLQQAELMAYVTGGSELSDGVTGGLVCGQLHYLVQHDRIAAPSSEDVVPLVALMMMLKRGVDVDISTQWGDVVGEGMQALIPKRLWDGKKKQWALWIIEETLGYDEAETAKDVQKLYLAHVAKLVGGGAEA